VSLPCALAYDAAAAFRRSRTVAADCTHAHTRCRRCSSAVRAASTDSWASSTRRSSCATVSRVVSSRSLPQPRRGLYSAASFTRP
jgi:hypothetical protein